MLEVIVLLVASIPGIIGGQSVCERFDIGGPCDFIDGLDPGGEVEPVLSHFDSYCKMACSTAKPWLYYEPCKCDSGTTTTPGPCTRSYLEKEVCEGASVTCGGSACKSTKNKYKTIKEVNDVQTCDCPLQGEAVTRPCNMTDSEQALCLGLSAYGLLPDDIKDCDCFTTLEPPTTVSTPESRYCYYTKDRPATLVSRAKRLYQATDVSTNCEYPGIVGIFSDAGKDTQQASCMAFLLTEDTLLIDSLCHSFVEGGIEMSALTDSYSVAKVTSSLPKLVASTVEQLNTGQGGVDSLYTVKLDSSLTFDGSCVEPVCFPCEVESFKINSSHIDFANCRVLGYGDTVDSFTEPARPSNLQEVKVQVAPDELTGAKLRVLREDPLDNVACFNEFGAPLVCSHIESNEWIAVGFHQTVGYPCNKGDQNEPVVQSFLQESFHDLGGNGYYRQLAKSSYTCKLD